MCVSVSVHVCGVCAHAHCVDVVSGWLGCGLCPVPLLGVELYFPCWWGLQPWAHPAELYDCAPRVCAGVWASTEPGGSVDTGTTE